MGQYAFYSFSPDTHVPVGEQMLPVPVRREMEREIFGGEHVCADLLPEELAFFLSEYPDFRGIYSGTAGTLAWLVGMKEGMEGDKEAAARHLQMGLEANPESLLLRSNYAIILQMQGLGEDAIEQYEVVLADPEGRENPMVCLLAARLFAENGEYMEAYRLLNELARGLPAEDAFWDFLAEMKELAGVEKDMEVAAPASAPSQACPACGHVMRPGSKFCRGCGRKVAGEQPGLASCPACGQVLRPGSSFCNKCGTQATAPNPGLPTCPACGHWVEAGARFCAECGSPL